MSSAILPRQPLPKKTYLSHKRRILNQRRRTYRNNENMSPLFEVKNYFKKASSVSIASERYVLEFEESNAREGIDRDEVERKDISETEINMKETEDIVQKQKKSILQSKEKRAHVDTKIRSEKQNMRKKLTTNGPSQNQMKPIAVTAAKINGKAGCTLATSTQLPTKTPSCNQDFKHKRSRQKSDSSLVSQNTSFSVHDAIVKSTAINASPNVDMTLSECVYDQAVKSRSHNANASSTITGQKVSVISNHAMPYHHLLSNLRGVTTSDTASTGHSSTPVVISSKCSSNGKSTTVISVQDFLSVLTPSSKNKRTPKKPVTHLEPLNFTFDAQSSPDPFISTPSIPHSRSPSPQQLFQRRANRKLSAQCHFGITDTETLPRVVATKRRIAFLETERPPKRIDYGGSWAIKCTTMKQRENRIRQKKGSETLENLRKKFVMPLGSTQSVRRYKKELIDDTDMNKIDDEDDSNDFTRSIDHNMKLPENDDLEEVMDTLVFSEYAIQTKFKAKKKVSRISPLTWSSKPSLPRVSYKSPQLSIDQTSATLTQFSTSSTAVNPSTTRQLLDTDPPSPVFPSRLPVNTLAGGILEKVSKIDKRPSNVDDAESIVTHVSESDLENNNHNCPSSEEERIQRKAGDVFDRESSAEITVSSLDGDLVNEMQHEQNEQNEENEIMQRKLKELNNEVLDSKESEKPHINVLVEEEAILNADPTPFSSKNKAQNEPNYTLCPRASISATLQLHIDHHDQECNTLGENLHDTSPIYRSHIATSPTSDAQLASEQKSTNSQPAEGSTTAHIRAPSISDALPIQHNLIPTLESLLQLQTVEVPMCQPTHEQSISSLSLLSTQSQ